MECGNLKNGIDKTFQDVEKLLGYCKYSDCTHTNEPGCKILEAIENGSLSRERYDAYRKLKNETKYTENSEEYLKDKREKFKQISKINKKNKR